MMVVVLLVVIRYDVTSHLLDISQSEALLAKYLGLGFCAMSKLSFKNTTKWENGYMFPDIFVPVVQVSSVLRIEDSHCDLAVVPLH